MAAALVGGAFLSGFINVVFDRLSSPEVLSLIRAKKLDQDLIQRLKNTLYAVEAVLNDAELKQIKDSAVNKWLDDLKDAVYVADDILDHFSTKAATQREVSSNFFSRYFNFQDKEMVLKLQDIVGRLESILKLKDILGLKEIARDNFSWRIPSTSLKDGSNIYGRDKDKEAILKLLLDDDKKSDGKISVIPIVGMGGVGKTTLAQLAYNDHNIRNKFDFQVWACVSEEFDILKVTNTITEAVKRSTCYMNDINLLQLDLKENLTGKKFLIVLDDVWTKDYVNWNFLIKPLQSGAKGSKILVTTRSEKVASAVQTVPFYRLKQLSDEDCWSVFASHACLSLESGENMALEKIGREIARKCKGLPLAAQSLGGLLRAKHDIRDWDNILNSNFWEFSENEIHLIPALRISYHYLPPYLKRCFVYCSLYPKDYRFTKQDLILLWMAEDLLQPPKNGKTLEEVGYGYFDDLASISFFQPSSDSKEYFVMHDLVHDLATLLGGREFYFQTEVLSKETKAGNKTRHLSFNRFSDPVSENFEIIYEVKFLRTFLPTSSRNAEFNNEKAPCLILSNLKYLRVLSFDHFPNLDTLPNSIGELIHLRYLNLSRTDIKTLPESLCNLYNLQTLMLQYCTELAMLPSGMQNLVNLRYLDISRTNLEVMPRGMSKLNHLQHLSCFIVGKHEENGIKELGKLSDLHGSLEIKKLESVTSSIEVSEARIMDKKSLNKLKFHWSLGDGFTDSQSEMEILHKLEPHQNLESLEIEGYKGTRFPEWVGDPSFHNMTVLFLYRCNNCCMLPTLGQLPSLKKLSIRELNGLEIITTDFFLKDDSFSGTPFPALEYLQFSDMACWEMWYPFESDAFPQLKELRINDCPRLRGVLPTHLPALEVLKIKRCQQLASSLPRAPAIRELQIVECSQLVLQELPLSLNDLRIGGRQDMESIFKAITQLTTLQHLEIGDCSSATSFPGDCLPTSLQRLGISNFRKLELPKQNQHQLLEALVIRCSCDSLKSLPLESFPNLSCLSIENCENLERLSVSESPLQNLESFNVGDCHKLKWLPYHMNTLLPKLQSLKISECPEIESFPEGGMPPNLRSLYIRNCVKLLRSQSLASMDMLTHLIIIGPCDGVMSLPEEGLVLLPPSLTYLRLSNFSSVDTLDCKGLLHLTSLQQLKIHGCPKLENVAGERLPASLIKLEISDCPLLEELCNTKHPQVWPKFSHIRGIMVNKRWIS